MSRFWTQFEAWLSMQSASSRGLVAAAEHDRRCQIQCIHNADAEFDPPKLVKMWAGKTPVEAAETLAKPDVTVTNMGGDPLRIRADRSCTVATLKAEIQKKVTNACWSVVVC